MSTESPGNGWWQASDGHWYPPEQHPESKPSLPPPPPPQSVASVSTSAPASSPAQGAAAALVAWLGVLMYLVSMLVDGFNYGWTESLEWGLGYGVLTDDWYDNWDKLSLTIVRPGSLIVLLVLAVMLTVRKNER